MPQLPKAYTPHDVEGAIYERWLAADVFAPDGAGSTADPALPPFTIIQPPPNITGSLHLGHAQRTAVEDLMIRHARMRGHPTLFLPGLDHASIAAQFVLDGILAKEGESRQSLGRERYLERMREFVADDARGHARPAAPGRRLVRLGPTCATRWTTDRRRPCASRSSTCTTPTSRIAPRRSSTGARAAGRASATSRSSSTPETGTLWSVRYHLIDPATGEPDPTDDDHGRHDPPRDDPRRHRRGRPSRRPALRGRSSDGRSASRSSSATCRSSPTTWSTRHSARARSRSPRRTTTTTIRPGLRHGLAAPTDPRRRRVDHRHRHALRRDGPVRRPRGDRRRPRGARRSGRGDPPRDGPSGAASAATTSSNRASRRSGSSAPARSRRVPSRRPAGAGRASCRSASRRPGSTG